MQKPVLGDPVAAHHKLFVKDGDLTRRAAETDEAQFQPEAQCLGKRDLPGALARYRRLIEVIRQRGDCGR